MAFEEHMGKKCFFIQRRDMLCVLLKGMEEGYETAVRGGQMRTDH